MRAEHNGETLILAKPLVERVLGEGVKILDQFPGSKLVGAQYEGPIFLNGPYGAASGASGFPIIAGDFVTTEDGTGLVHIAPAFGEDDFRAAAANGIFRIDDPQ